MSRNIIRAIALGALFAAVLGAPLRAAPADMVKSRIAGYKDLGAAFKSVNDALKSGAPAPATLQNGARAINALARQQYGWFPAGTGAEAGVKTRAKPEIWSQAKQFKAAQDSFTAQAKILGDVVAGGDIAKIQAQAKALSQTCSVCHRAFRTE